VVMPNTGPDEALSTIRRIAKAGLGSRPDGSAQTASLGLGERISDDTSNWRQVEVADARVYAAKSAGRNQVVGVNGIARPFIALDQRQRCEIPHPELELGAQVA
jgi:PleD family two-component response regulator